MTDDTPPMISAQDLRMTILRHQLAEIEKQERKRAEHEKALNAFSDSFLNDHVSDEERDVIRRPVMNAVQNDKFEALVCSLPSYLCCDRGRAINNRLPHWPETLQGKARELYDLYLTKAQPQGFRLKATIISFPGGMPGDVGLFLNWEPENPA